MFDLRLWIAQGFGSAGFRLGREFWFSPGAGLVALVMASETLGFHCWHHAGIFLSVWLCGEGEKILKQKDPGSVVLDEIAAIPVCFLDG